MEDIKHLVYNQARKRLYCNSSPVNNALYQQPDNNLIQRWIWRRTDQNVGFGSERPTNFHRLYIEETKNIGNAALLPGLDCVPEEQCNIINLKETLLKQGRNFRARSI